MTQKKASDVMAAIVDLLSPLGSEDRHRIVSAAFMLLGESKLASPLEENDNSVSNGTTTGAFLERAKTWMKQSGLSSGDLEQVFHDANGELEIIASDIPGKNMGEKTRNVYMLTGLANFLKTGEPTFSDGAARENCANAGCYDRSNHGKYMAGFGNEMSGSKAKGWSITAPGLKRGGTLIKDLVAQH